MGIHQLARTGAILCAGLLCGCLRAKAPAPGDAAPAEVHIETRVNTYTYNRQVGPSVDVDSNGNLLVAWGSRRQEQGTFGVFAQRFDPLGRRIGTEIHLNQTVRGMQLDPAVAFAADSTCWIVWQSDGQDGDGGAVIARRFGWEPSGGGFGPLTGEIVVNQTARGHQSRPAVTTAPGGAVLIAWTSDHLGREVVMGRILDAQGIALADEFRLGRSENGRESQPALATLVDEQFLVVWAQSDAAGKPADLYGRRLRADGTPLCPPFMVNDADGRAHIEPAVDAADDGRFVITWLTWDQSNYAVSFRLFDPAGEAACPARTAARGPRWCSGANVAMSPDGRFAIAYNLDADQTQVLREAPVRPSHRSTPSSIWARRFAADGQPRGAAFRVNRFDRGRQAIEIAASGRQAVWSALDQLVFVWTGNTGEDDHRGIGLSVLAPSSLDPIAPPKVAQIPAAQSVTAAEVYPLIPPVWDPNFVPEPRDTVSPFRGTDPGFLGIQNTGWNPPDPDIAAGPDHVVLVVNGQIAFFTQAGVQTFGQPIAGGGGFWGSVGATSFVFDPVAVYDVHSGRFVVAATEHANNGDDLIVLAVSDDSDPNGTWHKYRFNMTGFGDFIDFPNLGVDSQAIYITADFFSPPSGNWIFIIPKAPVLVGDPVTPTGIMTSGGPRSLGNVKTYDVDAPAQYFATSFSGSSTRVQLDAVTDPLGVPARSTFNLTVPTFGNPPGAAQLGTSNRASTIDVRIKNGVYRDGSLWLTHTIGQNATARVRWYEVSMNGWPTSGQNPALRQSGTLDFGAGEHNWMSDISVDDRGDAIICFSRSSVNQFISVQRVLRAPSDSLGTFQPPVTLQQSTSPETGDRWGDYAGVDEEPDLPGTFWTFNQYRTTSWRTWVGQVGVFRGLRILLPGASPEVLEPATPISFDVQIDVGDDTLVAGSPTLHYRYDGGAFLTTALTQTGPDLYTATLPAALCQDTPEFYVSADAQTGGLITNPLDAPVTVFTAIVATGLTRVDDGLHERGVGPPNGGEVVWLNNFIVQPGLETVGAMTLAWGPVADGTPTTVYLWSDPNQDGDPIDAQVLASAAAAAANGDTDIFTRVDLPDAFIGPAGTSYFIGAIISHQAGELPASLDESSLSGQSWVASDDVNPIDPNNLAAAGQMPLSRLGDIAISGNWLVRSLAVVNDCNVNGFPDVCDIGEGISLDCNANAIADDCEFPGCPGILLADMNCDGATDGTDVQRFLDTLLAGGYTCQADTDQDGVVSQSDVPGLVSALLGP